MGFEANFLVWNSSIFTAQITAIFGVIIRDFRLVNGSIVLEVGFVLIFYSRCHETRFRKTSSCFHEN